MTLTQGLHAAATGLLATARGVEVVASNIANQATPAYATRSLTLSSAPLGGVTVQSLDRATDPLLSGELRRGQADLAQKETLLDFWTHIEGIYSGTTSGAGMGERVNALQSALMTASAAPDSSSHLQMVVLTAEDLATGLAEASTALQAAREQADGSIAQDVGQMNSLLQKLSGLNQSVVKARAQGQDIAGFLDQRDAMINQLSEILPIRQAERDNGTVVLFSTDGTMLLQSQPAQISFTPAGTIRAESGALSGLLINGKPMTIPEGGRLGQNFAIRDQAAPAAQEALDQLAADLMTRLAAADPSLAAGQAGLLTDQGQAFDPAAQRGLSARLTLNPLLTPVESNQWRLRSGLAASTPAPIGEARILQSLANSLEVRTADRHGALLTLSQHVEGIGAEISTNRVNAQSDVSYAANRQSSLRTLEAQKGVDSDAEMQRLLQLETAYLANTRVLQSINSMLNALLEI